ncbi:MAG: hypothetical protein WCF90_10385 [Methanomicrobiales archaeon]
MAFSNLLLPFVIFILGIIAAFFFFRLQIGANEGQARIDLERWEIECTSTIR